MRGVSARVMRGPGGCSYLNACRRFSAINARFATESNLDFPTYLDVQWPRAPLGAQPEPRPRDPELCVSAHQGALDGLQGYAELLGYLSIAPPARRENRHARLGGRESVGALAHRAAGPRPRCTQLFHRLTDNPGRTAAVGQVETLGKRLTPPPVPRGDAALRQAQRGSVRARGEIWSPAAPPPTSASPTSRTRILRTRPAGIVALS